MCVCVCVCVCSQIAHWSVGWLRPPPRTLAQRDTVKAERVLVEQPLSDSLLLNYGKLLNQSRGCSWFLSSLSFCVRLQSDLLSLFFLYFAN